MTALDWILVALPLALAGGLLALHRWARYRGPSVVERIARYTAEQDRLRSRR